MRKLIGLFLALMMVMGMTVSASAVTTGKWDWDAARMHIDYAVIRIVQEQEVTEPAATEYAVAEAQEAETDPDLEPDTGTDAQGERPHRWRDWLLRRNRYLGGWK